MRGYDRRRVKKALRDLLFQPEATGTGNGHTGWVDPRGRRVSVPLRAKDFPEAHLYALGTCLEGLGVCARKAFCGAVKHGLPLRPF